MKTKYTHLIILLDRSGSMEIIKDFIIEGFNKLVQDQAEVEGDCTITLVQFDDKYEVLFRLTTIKAFPKLTDKTFVPRGMTPLVPATIKLIEEEGNVLANLKEEERPEKVIFVSISDGSQNSFFLDGERSYKTSFDLKEMVDHQKTKYNWQFIYIGANQDSEKEGDKYGVTRSATLNYQATERGVKAMFAKVSKSSVRYRSAVSEDALMEFTEEEQKSE